MPLSTPMLNLHLQAFDEAYATFKRANEQLDRKIELCLHSNGPWPTVADYEAWQKSAEALQKAGLAPNEN